jgi:multidrug efflux pump subunit AcrB
VGGLMVSTVMTLLVVPVLHSVVLGREPMQPAEV